MKFIKSLIVGSLLFAVPSFADNFSFRSAIGIGRSKKSALYSLNFEKVFDERFHYRLDVGFWSDTRPNQRGSFFTSFLLGKTLGNYKVFHGGMDVGLVAMSSPDSVLSSAFEFTEELSIGYKEFEIGYKHISNAGITTPNLGRDYLFLNYRMQL